jgi:uncharacterized protein (DUF1501 family)
MKSKVTISRRQLFERSGRLVTSLAGAAAVSRFASLNAFAQTAGDYKALVCIFLFGGNDSNNMIVPLGADYTAYKSARMHLSLAQSELLPVTTPTGAAYGLHPALADLHPLWSQGRLATIANVGMLVRPTTRAQFQAQSVPVPSNLFSHGDQQLQWQAASPNSGAILTGWSGRVADRLQGLNAPSLFPTAVSLSGNSQQLIGTATSPATISEDTPLLSNDGSWLATPRMAAIQEMLEFDSGVAVYQAASKTMKDALTVDQLLSTALAGSSPLTTTFPATSLGRQLAQVARTIKVRGSLGMRRQIFFVSHGGFDTHSSQPAVHENLLTDLGRSMRAFHNALESLGVSDRVTTFTQSEFGRTLQPNTSIGTDHAWGGHCLVMGSSVAGGKVYGTFPTLALGGPDDAGSRGTWIPTTSLDQYAATLAQWFGVAAADVPTVFPNLANFTTKTLGFLPAV